MAWGAYGGGRAWPGRRAVREKYQGRKAAGLPRPEPAAACGLHRVAGGLVDGLDQVFADAAFLLLVDLGQGLFPVGLLLGRQGDELGLAGGLDFLQGVVVFFLGDFVDRKSVV